MTDEARRVVIGLGHEFRGDDAAGLVVVDRLRERVAPSVEVVASDGDPVELMESWDGADSVVLVDAVVSGRAPGTVHVWHGDLPDVKSPIRSSSHQLGLVEVLALAAALQRAPRDLVVVGIEVAVVAPGAEMTPEVAAGVARAVDIVSALCCHPAAVGIGALYA